MAKKKNSKEYYQLLSDNELTELEELNKKIQQAKIDQTNKMLRRDNNVRNETEKQKEDV